MGAKGVAEKGKWRQVVRDAEVEGAGMGRK